MKNTAYIDNSNDRALIELLASGERQKNISKILKESNIEPNSMRQVELRLNLIRKRFNAKNNVHLVAILKDLKYI